MNIKLKREWKKAVIPLSFAVLTVVGLMGLSSAASATDLTGNATLTNDYVWRGSSQTSQKPAVQAGLKLAGQHGFYASAWGSNVKFSSAPDAASEFDLSIGWGRKLNDNWSIDINTVRYVYPGTKHLDWNEANVSATWRDRVWASVGHSANAMATHSKGTYYSVGTRIPVQERVRVELGAAHYAMRDALDTGYTHGWASAVWAFKAPFEARLTLHGTDNAAKSRFGADNAGTRAELALQASF